MKSILFPAADATVVNSFSSKELIALWKKSYNINVEFALGQTEKILEYRCEKSGLFFYIPAFSAGGSEFYQELQKFNWYYLPNKWEHRETIKRLTKGMRVLEVGCGEGSFVRRCLEQEIACEGIELNEKAAQLAQANGLPVRHINLKAQLQKSSNLYDFVVAFQVLEHIADPLDFIGDCVKLLKPGGRLVYAVPNSDITLVRSFNLLNMPPHHMLGWHGQALRSLSQIFQIEMSGLTTEPLADYHVDWYLNCLRSQNFIARQFLRFSFFWAIAKATLKFGANRFVKGHSIMAIYTKQ